MREIHSLGSVRGVLGNRHLYRDKSQFYLSDKVIFQDLTPALGLAPVVAHQIITAFGGTFQLVKGEGNNGYLEVILFQE